MTRVDLAWIVHAVVVSKDGQSLNDGSRLHVLLGFAESHSLGVPGAIAKGRQAF